MGIGVVVGLGIAVHVVLLVSIFDIYFTTPIIHGVTLVENNIAAPSKRVVVISVDGLRLDALLEDEPSSERPVAPYIRWSMSHRGTWGVSQCHLPTESRPGHVAMLAGFYEDPSAVTRGWKENPVDFDSIFNRSSCSFAWGSPDIVNIFYKGLTHNCSHKSVYNENQDFAGNTMDLDNWVLTEVSQFFESSGNPALYTKPNSLFFLHLLGQDTSGHTHKPKTKLYRDNLSNVDRIVKQIDGLFNRIFRDNGTAFVLTSDHGMTDWGSHGAGDPTETVTPIVAWGRGIRRIKEGQRVEINQADITPLLAVLIGVPIPVNSIGILPSEFLNVSQQVIAEANLMNALQINEQYAAKRTQVETKSSWLTCKHFAPLDKSSVSSLKESILSDIRNGRHSQANGKSRKLLEASLEGIRFYQNYFQRPLFVLVALSYVLWIIYLVLNLNGIERVTKPTAAEGLGFGTVSLLISYVIYRESLPRSYHLYAQLPMLMLYLIAPHVAQLYVLATNLLSAKRLLAVILFLAGVELFVLGFFQRWVLSVSLAAIVLWPLLDRKLVSRNVPLFLVWCVSGLSLGLFSILPVVGKQPYPALNLMAAISVSSVAAVCASRQNSGHVLAAIRCLLVVAAGVNGFYVHVSFFAQGELNSFSQILSWSTLGLSVLLLAEPASSAMEKLQNAFCTLAIPFLLLSVSHEGFFLLALFLHLACWVRLEMVSSDVVGSATHYQQYTRRKLHDDMLSISDLRRGYFFLAYIFISFFGIGNLATLNSFDPAWVRTFLTTFSPFTMTALILLKVIIPFFTVTLAFRVLTVLLNIRPYKVFVSVLIYCNVMALNFLFLVRNEGSWLDIGTSLSHYVIQQVAIVFLLVLYFASQLVIPLNLTQREHKPHFF